jgi:hypothetical protein
MNGEPDSPLLGWHCAQSVHMRITWDSIGMGLATRPVHGMDVADVPLLLSYPVNAESKNGVQGRDRSILT